MSAWATGRDLEVESSADALPESAEVETGFTGSVHGVALVDLLQIFHYSRRSLTLAIEPNSAIHLANGEIVHARTSDRTGEAALSVLLERTSGRFRTQEAEVVPTTIDRPFHFLLLDALRDMDESKRGDELQVWPEDSNPFGTEVPARGSRYPSVHAPGYDLLLTACEQLKGRVDGAVAVLILDLDQGRTLASAGSFDAQLLEAQGRSSFERPALSALDRLLAPTAALESPSFCDEVRSSGPSGLCFGKRLSNRKIAVLLCAKDSGAMGLAWAELRQSALMIERILP